MIWCVPKSIFIIFTASIFIKRMGHCLSIFKNYLYHIILQLLTTCFYKINILFLELFMFMYIHRVHCCAVFHHSNIKQFIYLCIDSHFHFYFYFFCYCKKAAIHIHLYPYYGANVWDIFKVIYTKFVFTAIFYYIFLNCFSK